MIVQLIGGAPNVGRYDDKVAVHDTVDGEDHGFLLKPDAAIKTATRIMCAVADLAGRDDFTFPVETIELTGGMTLDGERHARLVLTVEGAPLAIHLTDAQVAELAAGFTVASRALDQPTIPANRT